MLGAAKKEKLLSFWVPSLIFSSELNKKRVSLKTEGTELRLCFLETLKSILPSLHGPASKTIRSDDDSSFVVEAPKRRHFPRERKGRPANELKSKYLYKLFFEASVVVAFSTFTDFLASAS